MDVAELTIPVPWGHIAANSTEQSNIINTVTEVTKQNKKDSDNTSNDGACGKAKGDTVVKPNQPTVESNRDKDKAIKCPHHKTARVLDVEADPMPTKLDLNSFQLTPSNTKSQIESIRKEIQVNARLQITKKVKKIQKPKVNRKPSNLLSSVNMKRTEKNAFAIKLKPKTRRVSKSKKEVGKLDNNTCMKSSLDKSSKKMATTDNDASKSKVIDNQEKKTITKAIAKQTATIETPQDLAENSDFSRTYNMIKIQNPVLLASRAAKLNLVKQTLLNIENEKNSKAVSKDKSEKRCDDCGAPLCSGRDFIMHRDKCEVRQKKLEKILSGLNLPKSLQTTPQKDESFHSSTQLPDRIITDLSERFESNERVPSPIREEVQTAGTDSGNEEACHEDESFESQSNNSLLKSPSKTNKSPFRSLYNLYDGLNKEHIDIILSASKNARTLRSRPQEEKDVKPEKTSKEFKKNFEAESSQNEIIITTRITGNVIERNTLIRPVQNDSESIPTCDPTAEDEGQVNSRTLYETLKNSCQNPDPTPCVQEVVETPQPHRELISDCPQGLPRSANIRSLFKSHVLNPIRRKGPILPDSKKLYRLDRRNSAIEKFKLKSSKKKDKLMRIKSLLNNFIESPNLKKSTMSKKKKFLQDCQKDLRTSWQIEETDKRIERAMRASSRSIRKEVDVTSSPSVRKKVDVTSSPSVRKDVPFSRSIRNEVDVPFSRSIRKEVDVPSSLSVRKDLLFSRSVRKEVNISRKTLDSTNDTRDESDTQTKVVELAEEPREVQSVSTPKLFVPYNFNSTTPAKELALKTFEMPKQAALRTTETVETSLVEDQSGVDNSSMTNTTSVHQDPNTKSSNLKGTLSQSLPHPNRSESPSMATLAGRKSATPVAPTTPRTLEQILLKQEILEELKKLESRTWCDVCKKPFANHSSLTLHYSSLAHKKRVEKSLFGELLNNKAMTENTEKKVRGRKKGSKNKRDVSPESNDEVENMWCEDEEADEVLEPVEKKAMREKPAETLSTSSENTTRPVAVRRRRSSTLALEQTLADNPAGNVATKDRLKENANARNKVSPQSKGKMCTVCNVSFPSDAQLNKHFASKMHKTATVLIADERPKVCSVCKVSFSVNSQLHKHYATQMHKMAAARMVNELEERGVIKTALFP